MNSDFHPQDSGGDVQHSTGATVGAPGREARIDFGNTYGAVAGVSYTF